MQVIAYPYQYLIFNIEHSRYSKFKILHSIAFKLKFLTNEAPTLVGVSAGPERGGTDERTHAEPALVGVSVGPERGGPDERPPAIAQLQRGRPCRFGFICAENMI